MSDFYESTRKAYLEGYHSLGDENPYPYDTVEHEEWDRGWNEARDEEDREYEDFLNESYEFDDEDA